MNKCKNQFILEGTLIGTPIVNDYETYYIVKFSLEEYGGETKDGQPIFTTHNLSIYQSRKYPSKVDATKLLIGRKVCLTGSISSMAGKKDPTKTFIGLKIKNIEYMQQQEELPLQQGNSEEMPWDKE